jgi:large subunit ribosomal protein L6e
MKYFQCYSLLIPGPFKINACPLRRVSQNFVIATSTKLDISDVKLPEQIDDKYFKRNKQKRAKKAEGDIFNAKKEVRHHLCCKKFACMLPLFALIYNRDFSGVLSLLQ